MPAFYKNFIRPLSTDTDQAEREIVLNYLLVGIFGLAVVALIDTILAPIISHETYQSGRVATNLVTVLIIIGLYAAGRYGRRYRTIAVILTLLIAAFGVDIAISWGVLNSNGLLLFRVAVVMAGVLIGARYSLYMTLIIAAVLIWLQHGESDGSLHPDLSWLGTKPTNGDVIGFSAILLLSPSCPGCTTDRWSCPCVGRNVPREPYSTRRSYWKSRSRNGRSNWRRHSWRRCRSCTASPNLAS